MLICLLTSWNAPKVSPIASNNLLIENIEVLASGEGFGYLDRITWYQHISASGGGNSTHMTYCGDCEPRLCKAWSYISHCYRQ